MIGFIAAFVAIVVVMFVFIGPPTTTGSVSPQKGSGTQQQIAQEQKPPIASDGSPEAAARSAAAPEDHTPTPASAGGAEAGQSESAGSPVDFQPPLEPPEGRFGDVIRLGERIFVNTQEEAKEYVGNGLNCSNCHLDRGRLANSAPMWAAYVLYPAYRSKNDKVNTMEERIRGCFQYSMNGKPPAPDSEPMVALVSYFYWLANGAPVGTKMKGQGYPALADAEWNLERGQQVYAEQCAICHGEEGKGQKAGDQYVFPPLWGADSYNWGAGMHRISTAAAFIKANMPLGRGGTLTDQDAWDVAAFINSHPRPQDPRFNGDLEETREKYHNDDDFYGIEVNGTQMGSPESIPPARVETKRSHNETE